MLTIYRSDIQSAHRSYTGKNVHIKIFLDPTTLQTYIFPMSEYREHILYKHGRGYLIHRDDSVA